MSAPADELRRALGLRDDPDTDYLAVAPGRWSRPLAGPVAKLLTALGALAVGFLVTAGIWAGREAAVAQNARKAELIALVGARQERAEALSAQLDALRARVASAEREAAAASAGRLRERVARAEQVVGLTRLRGPGVRVILTDGDACAAARPEDCRVQDADLQLAVNTLFGLGADGVAINGERLIATTAVRSAGSAILVNYRVLTSPYVVEAVGDPSLLADGFAASALAEDFALWQDAFGLALTTEPVDSLVLPAYSGSVRLDRAEPAAGGGR